MSIVLLKEKIEKAIENGTKIVACIGNSFVECRNNFCVDNCEIEDDCIHMTHDSFELHINLCDATITHSDILDGDFTIVNDAAGTEVELLIF